MIEYYAETDFNLTHKDEIEAWLKALITSEGFEMGALNYIFCDDQYLLDINIKYLKHSTLTDIISFDYGMGKLLGGDIFVSIERVRDNTTTFNTKFEDELHRVMAHGILHFCGYSDKRLEEKKIMRDKEDYYLSLRTFL